MSDEELTPNKNNMDVDLNPNEASTSPAAAITTTTTSISGVVLDIGIGSGYISGSDDEDNNEPVTSKSSTPDSTTLTSSVTRKPLTTGRHPLTKTKSSLVNYERDSDDDEHTDEEEDDDANSDMRNGEDENSNSSSAVILHGAGDVDVQVEATTYTEQTIVTSDLLNVTPLKPEESSPSSRNEITPSNFPLIFPEDADIRIPPEPAKSCPPKLEKKFEDYYKRFKRTGINQNTLIQELKDFRNPCMYEKIISHLDIDEIGTNFPQDLYDPHWWGKESYYEELGKAQKLEMDRREKERQERTKIGFTPGVKKIEQLGIATSKSSDTVGEKRKTRFD